MARKPLTEEQKKVLAERLKKAREAKKAKKEAETGKKKEKPEVPPIPTPETPLSTPDSTAGGIPQQEFSTTAPPIPESPKEEKKHYIGGHTLDKEPIG